MSKSIKLFNVHKPKNAELLVSAVLNSGYWAEGESVKLFEKYLQEFLRNSYVLATNSCTSALHLALHCIGVRHGDYILTSPMTCIASNVSITNLGANPVWVDVDPIHGMMTPETLEQTYSKMSEQGLEITKGVLYTCWGGDMGPLKEVAAWCRKRCLPLIVDAAQAFGLQYSANKRVLGDCVYGDFVCLSFQAVKHISTGDGGALACTNEEDFIRASKLKWFGIDRDGFRTPSGEINWNSDIREIGYKFHMNNIAGAIGVAHMEELKETQYARLKRFTYNDALLSSMVPYKRSWNGATASWVATFIVDTPLLLLEYLAKHGIHSSQMHLNNDVYTGFSHPLQPCDLSGVKQFMETHLCLPCGPWLGEPELKEITYHVIKYKADKNGQ